MPETLLGLPIVEDPTMPDSGSIELTTYETLWDLVNVHLAGGEGGYLVPRDLAEQLVKVIPGAYLA